MSVTFEFEKTFDDNEDSLEYSRESYDEDSDSDSPEDARETEDKRKNLEIGIREELLLHGKMKIKELISKFSKNVKTFKERKMFADIVKMSTTVSIDSKGEKWLTIKNVKKFCEIF